MSFSADPIVKFVGFCVASQIEIVLYRIWARDEHSICYVQMKKTKTDTDTYVSCCGNLNRRRFMLFSLWIIPTINFIILNLCQASCFRIFVCVLCTFSPSFNKSVSREWWFAAKPRSQMRSSHGNWHSKHGYWDSAMYSIILCLAHSK